MSEDGFRLKNSSVLFEFWRKCVTVTPTTLIDGAVHPANQGLRIAPDSCRLEPAAHLIENAESTLVVHVISARLGAVELGPGLAPHLGQE